MAGGQPGQYPSVAVGMGGEAESTQSFASLQLAMVVASILIYGILASQFNSYAQPMIIMSNIVFSFTGVVFAPSFFGVLNIPLPGMIVVERSYFTVQVLPSSVSPGWS